MTEKRGCEYCENGLPLPLGAWDVNAFSAAVEAYVEGRGIVVEKYDGDMRIKARFCPMCGKELR